MSRRTATPQVTAQSGEELREGLLVVWERPARNSASSFYEAGIIESVDKGGESRRVHLAVLAPPPPPSGFFLPACAHRSPRCGCSSLFVILIHIRAPQFASPLGTPGSAPRIGTMRSRSWCGWYWIYYGHRRRCSNLSTDGRTSRTSSIRNHRPVVSLLYRSSLPTLLRSTQNATRARTHAPVLCTRAIIECKRDQRRAKRREPKDQPTRKPHRSFCWAPCERARYPS